MKLSLLAALLSTTLTVPAFADCNYGEVWPPPVVPAYSYAYSVALPEADAPFPECETEAESVTCAAEGLYGLACAAKMQRTYAACVGAEVCREAVQGWLEDDGVTGRGLEAMYEACLDLVAAAGGAE